MKIYQLAHSPFCIPITRVLDARGVSFETVEVPNHDRAAIIELTNGAYYQVPVIEDGGRVIFESGPDTQDVARHLDCHHAGGQLFPAEHEGIQAILIPHLENDIEGVTFRLCDINYVPAIEDVVARTMIVRHKERRFGRGCLDTWRRQKDELTADVARLMKPFDLMLARRPFLLGTAPVYADFLLFGILGNLTWHNWNPLPPLDHLRAWNARMAAFRFPEAQPGQAA